MTDTTDMGAKAGDTHLNGESSPSVDVAPSSTNLLDRLPVEIWRMCFQYCGRRRLHILCTVCRLFLEICRPEIFAKQRSPPVYSNRPNAAVPYSGEMTEQLEQTRRRILHTSNDRALAPLIKHWDLHADYDAFYFPAMELALRPMIKSFFTNLKKFENLRELELSCLTITQNRISKIAALTRLDTLKIELCSLAFTNPSSFPSLKVFVIFPKPVEQLHISNAFNMLLPQVLTTLDVASSDNAYPTIITPLSDMGVFTQLTYLRWSGVSIEPLSAFVAFLQNCPALQRIILENVSANKDVAAGHDDTLVFPRLTSYEGPVDLAKIFIPGNPVINVILFVQSGPHAFSDDSQIVLRALEDVVSLSSAPVTHLEVSINGPTAALFSSIRERFGGSLLQLKVFIEDAVAEGDPLESDDEIVFASDDESGDGDDEDEDDEDDDDEDGGSSEVDGEARQEEAEQTGEGQEADGMEDIGLEAVVGSPSVEPVDPNIPPSPQTIDDFPRSDHDYFVRVDSDREYADYSASERDTEIGRYAVPMAEGEHGHITADPSKSDSCLDVLHLILAGTIELPPKLTTFVINRTFSLRHAKLLFTKSDQCVVLSGLMRTAPDLRTVSMVDAHNRWRRFSASGHWKARVTIPRPRAPVDDEDSEDSEEEEDDEDDDGSSHVEEG